MELRFHKRVQSDLDHILRRYRKASLRLEAEFLAELQIGLRKARENPRFSISTGVGFGAAIWVVRHNRRNPRFGLKRFPQD